MEEEYQRVFEGEFGCYLEHPQGDNDKLLAGFCYLFGWIVSLVCLLAVKPLSPFLRFHAIQALGLQIFSFAIAMIMYITLFLFVGIILLPVVMGLSVYILVIGILILTGADHRVPYLANYVEERYV